MSTFGERVAEEMARMFKDYPHLPYLSKCIDEMLSETDGFRAGVEAAAEACDAMHDEPLDHSPDTPFDVGTNIGALKRCEELAAKIRALLPSAPEPKA